METFTYPMTHKEIEKIALVNAAVPKIELKRILVVHTERKENFKLCSQKEQKYKKKSYIRRFI